MTQLPTIDELKKQARRLRQAMSDRGAAMTQGVVLEVLAQQYGVRDWNTLSALSMRNDSQPPVFAVGDRVKGRYLGQPFSGKILALQVLPGEELQKITIDFDEPVDVVTFESFSAYRRRINAQVDREGVSPRRTSNGMPHLVLEL